MRVGRTGFLSRLERDIQKSRCDWVRHAVYSVIQSWARHLDKNNVFCNKNMYYFTDIAPIPPFATLFVVS